MADGALVSVVIPVFNGEAFLGEALRSVFAQTHDCLEVLVADDGSTDGSAAIAAGFPSVHLLSGPHQGVSNARNRAVEASRGEFLAFLDADDTWYPEKIARQVLLANTDQSLGVVMARQDYRFEVAIPRWFRGPTDGGSEPGFLPSAWFVRRACWDQVGEFNRSLTHGKDIDWLARARELGVRIGTADEVLLTRRIHGGNVTGLAGPATEGMLRALRGSVLRKRGAQI
jgi:glycosyltransferase involved in cell wall biosynthesis